MTLPIRIGFRWAWMIFFILTTAGCLSKPETDKEMRGLYVYLADAALFTECETGRRYPVAFEADSVSLERAYLEMRRLPGEEVLVSLEGHIAERPAMEGSQSEESLIVKRFIGLWPGETCGARDPVSGIHSGG